MQKSGTNIVKGATDFYNLVDRSGLLEEEKINETKNNLFNKAESNKENFLKIIIITIDKF